jgi:hypothetical protein
MTICSRAPAGAAAAAGTANSWSPRAPFHRCVEGWHDVEDSLLSSHPICPLLMWLVVDLISDDLLMGAG